MFFASLTALSFPATLTSLPFAAAGNPNPRGFTLGMEKGLGGLLPSHVQSHRGLAYLAVAILRFGEIFSETPRSVKKLRLPYFPSGAIY